MLKKIVSFLKKNPQYIIYFYFSVLVSFVAYIIGYAIVPDEGVHFATIEFFSNYTPSPFITEQSGSFTSGELTRIGPYFYYYLMGYVYNFSELINKNPLIAIRLLSVAFSLGTLIYLNKIADFLKVEKKIKLASLFFIANIPMFIIISAGVNYDAMTIFIATLIAYQLLKLSVSVTLYRSLLLFNLLWIGPLVKFALAPVSLTAFIVYTFLFFTRKNQKTRKPKVQKLKRRNKLINILLLVVLLAGTLLFIERYAVNYRDYGELNPSCDKIATLEQCKENFVFRRGEIYRQANLAEPEINYLNYMTEWTQLMNSRIYGVLSHKKFTDNYTIINIGLFVGAAILIMFVRKYKLTRVTVYIPLVFVIYLISLIMINLSGYRKSQEIGLAVQGRYIFPVLFPFVFLTLSFYRKEFTAINKSFAYNLLIAFLLTFSLLMGPINLYYGTNEGWYRDTIISKEKNYFTAG